MTRDIEFNMDMAATYGASTALLLNQGFTIRGLVSDCGGDCDNGWLVALSSYGVLFPKRWYVHVLHINCMETLKSFWSHPTNEINEGYPDYEEFSNRHNACVYIFHLAEHLHNLAARYDPDKFHVGSEYLDGEFSKDDSWVGKFDQSRIRFMFPAFLAYKDANYRELMKLGKGGLSFNKNDPLIYECHQLSSDPDSTRIIGF